MSLALYRKYRPKTFSKLVGQDTIKTSLLHEIQNGQVAHAYLFSGPRGVGKTTTARLLARAVNCKKIKDGEPDNTCDFCTEILEGRSLDIIEIDAASNTGVDHVREHIIENSRFTPQRLPMKVFVIDEVHMLSTSAFNALLKTLEEPPAHAMFILATTEIHKVPETIISRCQRFDFKRIGTEDLMKRLDVIAKQEKVSVDPDVMRTIARRANGSSRDAEVLLTQLLALGDAKITQEQADLVLPRSDVHSLIQLITYLQNGDTVSALTLVNRLASEGAHMGELMDDLIELLRKIVLINVGGGLSEFDQSGLDDDAIGALRSVAGGYTLDRLLASIETLLEKKSEARDAPLPQLPLELAVLSIIQSGGRQAQPASPQVPPATEEKKKAKTASPPVAPPRVQKPHASATSLNAIHAWWPKILEGVRKDHRGLYLLLKAGKVVSFDGSLLTLGFPFKLLAEQANSVKSRAILLPLFREQSSQDLEYTTSIVEEDQQAPNPGPVSSEPESGAFAGLLESLGGEVVGEE